MDATAFGEGTVSPALAEKLGLRPGMLVLLADAPEGEDLELLDAAPCVAFHNAYETGGNGYDAALWWPKELRGLGRRLDALSRRVRSNGAVWVVMPKKPHASSFGVAAADGDDVSAQATTGATSVGAS
jgi:hypothetical protein